MKQLRCSFSTVLDFGAPVTGHTFALMLTPMEGPRQRLLSCRLQTDPCCALAMSRDGFGNTLHLGYLPDAHRRLAYSMEAVVSVDALRTDHRRPLPLLRYPTGLTALETAPAWASELPPMEDRALALELMHRVYEHLCYRPGSTNTRTTAAQALCQGCGVCQDYAHILLGLLRLRGIPCAYVTGLLLGQGQTHAWVEVWCGGQWLALDPTNNRVVDEDYVTLGHGRDFLDCSVDRGIYHSAGPVSQVQTISAQVEPL